MSEPHAPFDFAQLPRFRRALLKWYRRHARKLPWRETADPYHIWISEIMLQQTTVAAVVPYFEKFLLRFPDVETLAQSPQEEVLRLWEGLGYYSRARNIHATAGCLVSDYGGCFPETVDDLMRLPGIGRYTAGAIVSFAFGRPAPIVEANTLRLYSRLLGYRGDPRSTEGQHVLWSFAERVLPRTGAGRVNQALMELGATVCTAETPACDRCPVRTACLSATHGWQGEIPQPAKRAEITAVTEVAVAVRRSNRYLLLKRRAGERWAGLWDFVRFPCNSPPLQPGNSPPLQGGARGGRAIKSVLATQLRNNFGIDTEIGDRIATFKHGVTRYRITLLCYLADWHSGDPDESACVHRWVRPNEFASLPLSTTGRKLAKLLEAQQAARGRPVKRRVSKVGR